MSPYVEILNQNNYAPQRGAGELGQPVYLPDFEAARAKTLYHVNKFNILASDRISVNRSLPDPRKESCRKLMYDLRNLPDASVIIVFHNEAWSTLLRTVHSVINRTPKKILKEIILVDDASDREFLKKPLNDYIDNVLNAPTSKWSPVRLLRSENRTGLIRARLIGAAQAQGSVLTFLDAHCEVTIGWLEPMLNRISNDRSTVVCPVIDIISEDTFAYAKSFELHWGGLNWNLHFRWFPIGQRELRAKQVRAKAAGGGDTDPYKTPIMAGGLFAIDRNYFYQIGSYDEEMDIWGGENIEMSLRIWQCGGRIEISPCSHVAHLFRKASPYTFPREGGVAGVLYTNLARVIDVWMDEYKSFFYEINPIAKKTIFGDDGQHHVKLRNIETRRQLKKKLECKPFSWFLKEVWPENFFPANDRFFGQIKSSAVASCLQRPNAKNVVGGHPVGRAELEPCAIETYSAQAFVYTKTGFLMTDESVCLDVTDPRPGAPVMMLACAEFERQKWRYETDRRHLIHIQSGLCATVDSRTDKQVTVARCSSYTGGQRWDMVPIDWK